VLVTFLYLGIPEDGLAVNVKKEQCRQVFMYSITCCALIALIVVLDVSKEECDLRYYD
jgi:hypothetical protein